MDVEKMYKALVRSHICRVKKINVIPAKAGIQCFGYDLWIPAFAGMTGYVLPDKYKRIQTLLKLLIIFLMISVLPQVFAATEKSVTELYDIKAANKQFDTISIQLSTQQLQLSLLSQAIQELAPLHNKAQECVKKSEEQLKSVDNLIKDLNLDTALQQKSADYRYLETRKNLYTNQLSECRLFVYRAEEALMAYKNSANKLTAHNILSRNTPIWAIAMGAVHLSANDFSSAKLYKASGFDYFSQANFFAGFIVIILGIIVGAYIRSLASKWYQNYQLNYPILASFARVLARFSILIMLLLCSSLYLLAVFWEIEPNTLLQSTCNALLLYVVIIALSNCLFLPAAATNLLKLKPSLAKQFHRRIIVISTLVLTGFIVSLFFHNQNIPIQLIELARTVFIIIICVLVVWFFSLCSKHFVLESKRYIYIRIMHSLLVLSMSLTVAAELLGFHRLVAYLLECLLLTILSSGVLFIILWQISGILSTLDNGLSPLSKKIRRFLGVGKHKKLKELTLLKISLFMIVVAVYSVIVVAIWEPSPYLTDKLVDILTVGFSIGSFKISLLRIALAIFIFALIQFSGRFISANISRRHTYANGQDVQIALASIIVYISFAIALLVAFLIAGVNFTNLAIIAGALSVGIGLGLQDIINNFASGIVLLLEKHIKPGDRIVVGGVEGFVHKIRIRATQIKTMSKEDVIMPNSKLIKEQVTNYMFRDPYWRIVCPVGVAYGSDTVLVKSILLAIAVEHPDILQDELNQPLVFFRNFGESTLNFELTCIIDDVNKKSFVISDINFAIEREFRKNNIVIAFPQRDVHIIKDEK